VTRQGPIGKRAVQYIEKKRFEDLRNFLHALEIKGLKTREGQVVFCIVEHGAVRTTLHPLLKRKPEVALDQIGKCREPTL
jgi:hypothetical protein